MGKPSSSGAVSKNGESLDVISYAYAKAGADAGFGGDVPVRSMSFTFHKSLLVSTETTSSFPADSTAFDYDKAKTVKNGMKAAEVVALMGKPGGESRYPVVAAKDGRALVYTHLKAKGFKQQHTQLVVELDKSDVVVNTSLVRNGEL